MNGKLYSVSWNGFLGGPETLVEVWVAETATKGGGHRHGHWRVVRDKCGHEQGTWHRAVDRAFSETGRKD